MEGCFADDTGALVDEDVGIRQQFGMAFDSNYAVSGILGMGYGKGYNIAYNNIVDSMVEYDVINAQIYSVGLGHIGSGISKDIYTERQVVRPGVLTGSRRDRVRGCQHGEVQRLPPPRPRVAVRKRPVRQLGPVSRPPPPLSCVPTATPTDHTATARTSPPSPTPPPSAPRPSSAARLSTPSSTRAPPTPSSPPSSSTPWPRSWARGARSASGRSTASCGTFRGRWTFRSGTWKSECLIRTFCCGSRRIAVRWGCRRGRGQRMGTLYWGGRFFGGRMVSYPSSFAG